MFLSHKVFFFDLVGIYVFTMNSNKVFEALRKNEFVAKTEQEL